MKKILSLLFLILLSFAGYAQNRELTQLDAYLDNLEIHEKFMGSIALSKDRNMLFSKAVGTVIKIKELNPPLIPNTG